MVHIMPNLLISSGRFVLSLKLDWHRLCCSFISYFMSITVYFFNCKLLFSTLNDLRDIMILKFLCYNLHYWLEMIEDAIMITLCKSFQLWTTLNMVLLRCTRRLVLGEGGGFLVFLLSFLHVSHSTFFINKYYCLPIYMCLGWCASLISSLGSMNQFGLNLGGNSIAYWNHAPWPTTLWGHFSLFIHDSQCSFVRASMGCSKIIGTESLLMSLIS